MSADPNVMGSPWRAADEFDLAVVAEGSAQSAWFWSATPGWLPAIARRRTAEGLLVWTGDEILTVPMVPSAIVEHFDGQTPLLVLAEDFAEAARVTLDEAKRHVALAATFLTALGACDRSPVQLPPKPELSDETDEPMPSGIRDGDVQTLAELERNGVSYQLEDGRKVTKSVDHDGKVVTIEETPNGEKTISTTITIDSSSPAGARQLAQIMAGDRSPAELAGPDTCVGARLRAGDDIPLTNIQSPGGHVLSVRCQDDHVRVLLEERFGDRVVVDERGPVCVFTTTAFEGTGPVRVYDGNAQRRGRPRSPLETVDLVDHLLGEHDALMSGFEPAGPLAVPLAVANRSDQTILIPARIGDEANLHQILRKQGWTLISTSAWIDARGHVAVPTLSGPTTPVGADATLVLPNGISDAELVIHLTPLVPVDPEHRQVALDRIGDFVEQAPRLVVQDLSSIPI